MSSSMRNVVCLFLAPSAILVCLAFRPSSGATELRRECSSRSADGGIKVCIYPRNSTLYPGGSVSVRCHVYGGSDIVDIPYVNFVMMVDRDTVLPLSSGLPGVSIERMAPNERSGLNSYNVVATKLTIDSGMYPLLKFGNNVFICRGVNLNGDQNKQQFSVYKQRGEDV